MAEPERQVYLNGSWVPLSEAHVSILDHGFLYGDGVFEGIRSYMGRPFRLDDHVRRLFESAHSIRLDIGLKPEEVSAAVLEALRLNRLEDAYIRVQVSRGTGDLGLDPRSSKRATVFVLADRISLYPASLYDEGLRALTVSIRRTSVDSLSPRVKSLNYLNNILAKEQATTSGYAEAILLGSEGFPIEATGENLFVVRRGELWTPPLYLGILDGITRRTILELAAEPSMGLTVREMPFTLHDLYVAEECFLTGTAAEIVPVVEVDGRRIGAGSPGPVTGRLRSRFASYVRDIVRVS